MPYISTEALVGAVLLVVLAFGYQYIPISDASTASSSLKSKKKNKKKLKVALDTDIKPSEPVSKKFKGKQRTENGAVPPTLAPKADIKPKQPPSSNEEESDTGPQTFASVTQGTSSSAKQKPKTLAEKIAPKNRKTKVDDMLAPEDRPASHARVMRVKGPGSTPGPAPAPIPVPEPVEPVQAVNPLGSQKVTKQSDSGSSSENEEEDDVVISSNRQEEDDGWNVVASKPKKPISISMNTGSTGSTSQPLPVATKLQKKNAKKAETKKAVKALEEAERQKRLAAHRKDLQRERINEIYNQKQSAAKGAKSTPTATVDAGGKLIWD